MIFFTMMGVLATLFLVAGGITYGIVCVGERRLVGFSKRRPKPIYSKLSGYQLQGVDGQVYVRRPSALAHHRCINRAGDDLEKGSIWVCTCGRSYFARPGLPHVNSDWTFDRKYWWRIRWPLFPWHFARRWRARQLSKGRYSIEGRVGV